MIYVLLAIPVVGYLVGCYVERKLHDAVNEMARREEEERPIKDKLCKVRKEIN